MTYPEIEMLIDGQWTKGHGGDEALFDPATGQQIGRTPHASVADLDLALSAAEKGFAEWSRMSPFDHQQAMEKAARLLDENGGEKLDHGSGGVGPLRAAQ